MPPRRCRARPGLPQPCPTPSRPPFPLQARREQGNSASPRRDFCTKRGEPFWPEHFVNYGFVHWDVQGRLSELCLLRETSAKGQPQVYFITCVAERPIFKLTREVKMTSLPRVPSACEPPRFSLRGSRQRALASRGAPVAWQAKGSAPAASPQVRGTSAASGATCIRPSSNQMYPRARSRSSRRLAPRLLGGPGDAGIVARLVSGREREPASSWALRRRPELVSAGEAGGRSVLRQIRRARRPYNACAHQSKIHLVPFPCCIDVLSKDKPLAIFKKSSSF